MSRVQVTFRHVFPSDIAREIADRKFGKLQQQLLGTARCHVVIDRPAASQSKGALVHARVDVLAAGVQIATEASDLDACVAIREAFERAQIQAQRSATSRKEARSRRRARVAREKLEPA